MEENHFEYSYSAPTSEERKEIESIRNNYIKKDNINEKLDRLRKIDGKVRETPGLISLIIGISGILIFGLGLAMILEWKILAWGIVVSVVGVAAMFIAYPIYIKLDKRMRDKYLDEILKLSDELLNDENK